MLINLRFRVLLAILFLPLSNSFPQKLYYEERQILTFQDQRSLGGGKLLEFLTFTNSLLRYRAAIALANIQDTSTVKYLLPALGDSVANVRVAAAFALGQIGSRAAQTGLISALRNEQSPAVLARIAEALGRCADEHGLEAVISYRTRPKSNVVKRDLALAVARFTLRGIKNEPSVWFCFDLIRDKDPEVQWRALYALWRAAPSGLIDVEIAKRRGDLLKLVKSPSADVRIQLATLLARCNSKEAVQILQELDKSEKTRNDWRVLVQVVRGYGAFVQKNPDLLPHLDDFLSSSNGHVKIATMQALESLPRDFIAASDVSDDVHAKLLGLAVSDSRNPEFLRGEAFVVLGKHFPGDVDGFLPLLESSEVSDRLKAKVLEALQFSPSRKVLETYLVKMDDPSVRVAMAAWDFARRLFNPAGMEALRKEYQGLDSLAKRIYGKSRDALARNDMGIGTLVGNAVADSGFFSLFQNTPFAELIVGDLTDAYSRFSVPNDVEAMQAIVDALGKAEGRLAVPMLERALESPDRTVALGAARALKRITGKDYSEKLSRETTPLYTDYDWQLFESIPAGQKVSMRTTKGVVVVELLKEEAPFTVLSFVRLVKKKFYDGLTFHRVVPNFVIQGGDPRGDGWGGPGYAIRSEFAPVGFERGSVGIASAGKDTEGCQFFITHSPQPHLEGRYTVFGKVTAGLDVVDKIQVGDKMLRVELVH